MRANGKCADLLFEQLHEVVTLQIGSDQFVVYFVVLKFYIFIRNIIICNRTGNKTISDKKGLAVMYVIRITPVLDAIIIRRLVACSLCINTESAIYGGS